MSDKHKIIKECEKFNLSYEGINLLEIFPEPSNAIEIYLTLVKAKPVTRLELSEKNLDKVKEFCNKSGLYFVVSDFSYLVEGENVFYVYFSQEEKLVSDAKRCESSGDDYNLGLLLGYPPCCARFYIEKYDLAARLFHRDHTIITLKHSNSSENIYFGLNYLLRFFSLLIIDFYPCSFQCENAIKVAKNYFEKIRSWNPEFADYLKKKLMTAVYYSNETGVHVFEDCKFRDGIIEYENILLTSPNPDYEQFKKANRISKTACFGIILFESPD